MSIRNRAGEWQPLTLGIEPECCGVCGQGLSRNYTLLRGGWERCTLCHRFVHYNCLVSGKVSFLRVRPRVCRSCHGQTTSDERAASDRAPTATTQS